jgi:exodeoxyribonuclease VII small subunit
MTAHVSSPIPVPAEEQQPDDFERMLKELEALVTRLEQGDLPLEESLREFERGIELTRACERVLRAAEQKVEILLEPTVDAEPAPFESRSG